MVRLPWQVKIISKVMLSRLPLSYHFWKRLGLFDMGEMDNPAYACAVFNRHYGRAEFPRKGQGFVMLEIGPGDSLASGVLAHLNGARRSYLVDAGPFASPDMGVYRKLLEFLEGRGFAVAELQQLNGLEELMSRCDTVYKTGGLASLHEIPDASVDFIWSQVALEMVRLEDLEPLLRETRRVLRPGGVCSHCIDLSDLINHSLNNLRFSERVWESEFMARSGFYTNRLRPSQLLELFDRAGFEAEVVHTARWAGLPVPRGRLHPDYKRFADEELTLSEMDVILRPKEQRTGA